MTQTFPDFVFLFLACCHCFSYLALTTSCYVLRENEDNRMMRLESSSMEGSLHSRVKRATEQIKLGNSGLYIYKKKANWTQAFCSCTANGRSLATLLDAKKARTLIDHLWNISLAAGAADHYWIGLHDNGHEGKWEWVGNYGSLKYDRYWQKGQPDHVDRKDKPRNHRPQHCVQLASVCFHLSSHKRRYSHRFDDQECDTPNYFICEKVKQTPKLPPPFGRCPPQAPSGPETDPQPADRALVPEMDPEPAVQVLVPDPNPSGRAIGPPRMLDSDSQPNAKVIGSTGEHETNSQLLAKVIGPRGEHETNPQPPAKVIDHPGEHEKNSRPSAIVIGPLGEHEKNSQPPGKVIDQHGEHETHPQPPAKVIDPFGEHETKPSAVFISPLGEHETNPQPRAKAIDQPGQHETNPQSPAKVIDKPGEHETNPHPRAKIVDPLGEHETKPSAVVIGPLGEHETNPQSPAKVIDKPGKHETNPQSPTKVIDQPGQHETNQQSPAKAVDQPGEHETDSGPSAIAIGPPGEHETNPQTSGIGIGPNYIKVPVGQRGKKKPRLMRVAYKPDQMNRNSNVNNKLHVVIH